MTEQEMNSNHQFHRLEDGGALPITLGGPSPQEATNPQPRRTTINLDGGGNPQTGLYADLEENLLGEGGPGGVAEFEEDVDIPGQGLDHVPKPKHTPNTSILRAGFHLFKGNVGAGIFLLPMTYNDAGYILGPIFAIICGTLATDCSLMLLRTKKRIGRDDFQTYPKVAQYVFGNIAFMLVNAALVLCQYGFCLMYLQFASLLIQELVNFNGAYKVYVFSGVVLITPLTFLTNNLRLLAVSSAAAGVCVLTCIILTFIYSIVQLGDRGPATSRIVPAASAGLWSLFFGSSMSVLEGIGLILPVENSVKEKERFPKFLMVVMCAIIAMYLIYALTAYLTFGNQLTTSIIDILPPGILSTVLHILLAVNLLLTYPLQFVPAIQIVDRTMRVEPHRIFQSSRAIASRILINLFIAFAAVLVGPDTIGLMLAFIGSVCATYIAIILPSMMQLQVDYAVRNDTAKRSGWSYYKKMFTEEGGIFSSFLRIRCVIYIVLGIAILIAGTITCVVDAGKMFHKRSAHHHATRGSGSWNATNTSSYVISLFLDP